VECWKIWCLLKNRLTLSPCVFILRNMDTNEDNIELSGFSVEDIASGGAGGQSGVKSVLGGRRLKKWLSGKAKVLELLGEEAIDNAFRADFLGGNRWVRQFVYEHRYDRPATRVESDNTHNFPSKIVMEIVDVDTVIDENKNASVDE
jgi:hypothetical protein